MNRKKVKKKKGKETNLCPAEKGVKVKAGLSSEIHLFGSNVSGSVQ